MSVRNILEKSIRSFDFDTDAKVELSKREMLDYANRARYGYDLVNKLYNDIIIPLWNNEKITLRGISTTTLYDMLFIFWADYKDAGWKTQRLGIDWHGEDLFIQAYETVKTLKRNDKGEFVKKNATDELIDIIFDASILKKLHRDFKVETVNIYEYQYFINRHLVASLKIATIKNYSLYLIHRELLESMKSIDKSKCLNLGQGLFLMVRNDKTKNNILIQRYSDILFRYTKSNK